MTLRNALVTDCTVLRNSDGTDNEHLYDDIVCLTGDIQRKVVFKSFAKIRPSAAHDEQYDEAGTNRDDDEDVEENIDWSVQLEAVVVAPKKARMQQKTRQPVTGKPRAARKRGRPKKAALLLSEVAPDAVDEDFIEPDIVDELNRAADLAFAARINNDYDDGDIVDLTL
jgi:hypothetical protein